MVPATNQWINRESGDMNARIAYTRRVRWRGNGYYGQLHPHQKARTSERPWKQLGGRSHYCASLTPASDLPRRGRADLSGSPPRLRRGTNAVNKSVRARGENGASWSPRERADYRVPRRVYDETLLGERGKCDVRDWPSAGPSASVRHVLRETQSVTRGRGSFCKVTVAMRRFLSTAAVCCWLLVALGVGQVSTRNCSLSEIPPLDIRQIVSNAPASAPEAARVCTRMCRQTAPRETWQELGSESKLVRNVGALSGEIYCGDYFIFFMEEIILK